MLAQLDSPVCKEGEIYARPVKLCHIHTILTCVFPLVILWMMVGVSINPHTASAASE